MNKTITFLIIGVIFLALLLMVFNSFKMEDLRGVPASVTEKARVPEERAALAPSAPEAQSSGALAPSAAKNSPQQAESDAAEQSSSAAGVAVKTVPAQIDAGHAPPDPPPSPPVSPRLTPSKAPVAPEPNAKHTGGGVRNITNIVVYATQEGATLRIGGDSPLVYKSMLLHNPDRFVLDLEGQWNVNIPAIPPNKIVKAVRVGRQADSTRMVVDLHRVPASSRVIKTSPQRLDVRFR
ncbi:MAG: AMIN domain-containing protein [Deltaproteobacteria bacterium]|jgi:hypothetical protein|nr:AMIN domain-containing protein [Deltaproteobacteria bacterium]